MINIAVEREKSTQVYYEMKYQDIFHPYFLLSTLSVRDEVNGRV